MEKFALLVRLEAKPGKEKEVSDFIRSALPLAQALMQKAPHLLASAPVREMVGLLAVK